MKFSLTLIVLLFLFGCRNKTAPVASTASDSPQIIDIARDFKNIKEFRVSEIADDIEYIKLEKTPESLIGGGIPTWYITEEFIFVAAQHRLLQFYRDGRFIKQIGKSGRGPGEFQVPLGIMLDDSNDTLCIITNYSNQLLKFDVNSGEYLSGSPVSKYLGSAMFSSGFHIIGKDTFAAFSHPLAQFQPDYVLLEIFDGNGNILKQIKSSLFSFKDEENIQRVNQASNQIWRFNNEFRLYEGLNDTIYNLNDNLQLEPAYIFNLGKYKGTFEEMTTKYYNELPNYIQINGIWETQNALFLNFIYNGKFCKGQFNKSEGKFYWQDVPGDQKSGVMLNDLDGGLSFWPNISVDHSENERVFCIDAINLKQQLTNEYLERSEAKFPEKKEQLKNFMQDLSIDDNPVLMLVKLKN